MEGLDRELKSGFYSVIKAHEAPELQHPTRTPRFLISNSSVKYRSHLLFIVLCLGCLGALATAYTTLSGLNGSIGKLGDSSFQRVLWTQQMRAVATELMLAERDFLAEDLLRGMQAQKTKIDAKTSEFDSLLKKVVGKAPAHEILVVDRLKQSWAAWKSFDKEVVDLALAGDPDAAIVRHREGAEVFRNKFENATLAFADYYLDLHEDASGISAALYTKYRSRILLSGVFLMLIVAFSGIVLLSLSKTVEGFADGMRKHSFQINMTTNRILGTATERMSAFSEQKILMTELSLLIEESQDLLHSVEDERAHELRRSFEKLDTVAGRCSDNSENFLKHAEDLRQQSDSLKAAVVNLLETFSGTIGGERVPRLPVKPKLASQTVATPQEKQDKAA